MRALWTRLHGDVGFTVAEYLSATVILLVVALATTSGLTFASASTANSAKREQAMNLANQRLEQARNLPYDKIGVRYADGGYGNPPGEIVSPVILGDFTVETEVKWKRDETTSRATYKKIYVTVSWDKPRSSSLTVESAVMGKSTLVNAGDVLINVYDGDTNAPLGGAAAQITPSTGGQRTMYTDASQGEAFFGYVPSGAMTVVVAKTGYVVDATPLSGASVPIDDIARYAVYATKASTGRVKVIDSRSGSAISGASVHLTGAGIDRTVSTGADGVAVIDQLPKGDFTFEATATGWISASGTLNVPRGGSVVDASVSLTRPAQIRIHVAQANGTSIPGASVVVNPGSNSMTTGSSGDATFDLDGGNYSYLVTKAGFLAASADFTVTTGQDDTINVTLAPIPTGTLRIVATRNGNPSWGTVRIWRDGVWLYDKYVNGSLDLVDMQEGFYQAKFTSSAKNTASGQLVAGQTLILTVKR